jgi:penicillin V acylase-like amidase (Ntn superfamily)
MFGEELKAVAEQTGLSVGRLVLLQLAYEASTCCTSIVAPGVGGIPIHGRTMDWEMEYLKPLSSLLYPFPTLQRVA